MKINADFDQKVVVHSAQQPWLESPMAGVLRRPLDRVGTEVARATSIVKYLPNSHFSPHTHTGGEEFLVLDGVFQDEHGDFPAGSYVRNPPTSAHTPSSEDGCVIFVKLWQFDEQDRQHVNINTLGITEAIADDNGIKSMSLYNDQYEDVSVQSWPASSEITVHADDGLECLVLNGGFTVIAEKCVTHSWIRLPSGQTLQCKTGQDGAVVWLKRNHLRHVGEQINLVSQTL